MFEHNYVVIIIIIISSSSSSSIAFFKIHFVVPMGISHMENSGRFPQGKPAATESRYPTLTNN